MSFKCVLCGEIRDGWGWKKQYGNNPYPLSQDSDCCDECDMKKVIPARLKKMGLL